MQLGVTPGEVSGIIHQAQTPGLWDLLESSGRPDQEALLPYFFFFHSIVASNAIIIHPHNPLHV